MRWGMTAGLLVGGVLGLTGCSGSHPQDLPPADDPVAWAGRVCSSLQPLTALRNQRPSVDPSDPAASRQSLSSYFDDTGTRIEDSLKGLDQVGPSPIAGGDEITTKLRGALRRLHTAFGDARGKVDAIDGGDPVELDAKLPDILSALAAASSDKDLSGVGGNPALADAVRQSPSCGLLKSAGGTGN